MSRIPLHDAAPARSLRRGAIAVVAALASVLCASCADHATPLGPFSDGGARTRIVVISDIHLGADLAYAECNANRAALVDFLEQVRGSGTVRELVIAGDFIDEWFVPATTATYAGGDQAGFVARVAAANRDVIAAIARIIRGGDILVTYVPGNHDLTITAASIESILPGIRQARDDAQGLGTYSPQGLPGIAIEHGHRYNFFCAPDPISNAGTAPGSILPPGYFFTRIATLHVLQRCTVAGDTVATVTPNAAGGEQQGLAYAYWGIWRALLQALPIENRFDEPLIVTGVGGFTRTYAVGDLLPRQAAAGGHIDIDLFAGSLETWEQRQALNHVAVPFPVTQALAEVEGAAGMDGQATRQYFANPSSSVRLVVFGHTHDAKLIATTDHAGRKAVYANSGTWIDRNPGSTTMDFVVITPQGEDPASQTDVQVYRLEGRTMVEMAADSLRL